MHFIYFSCTISWFTINIYLLFIYNFMVEHKKKFSFFSCIIFWLIRNILITFHRKPVGWSHTFFTFDLQSVGSSQTFYLLFMHNVLFDQKHLIYFSRSNTWLITNILITFGVKPLGWSQKYCFLHCLYFDLNIY